MRRTSILAGLFAVMFVILLAESGGVPVGEVIGGASVAIGSTTMPRGSLIFSGDTVKTGAESTILQTADKGKIEIFPNSAVQLTRNGQAISLRIVSGKAAFAFPKGSAAQVQTQKGSILPQKTDDRYYGVVETTPAQDTIQSFQGSLTVNNQLTGESSTLRPGYRANLLTPTGTSGAGTEKKEKKNKDKGLVVWFVGGAAGATAASIALYEVLKEETPESTSK